MEGFSVNRLGELLEVDRRTIRRWVRAARVEPIREGPNGPLYSLPRVAAILADADRLAEAAADRQDSWRWLTGQRSGACEAVGRLLEALAGTLPKRALRQVREASAELLRVYVEEVDALIGGASEPPSPSAGPDWSEMPDGELVAALRAVVDGEPDNAAEDEAA